MMMNLCKDSAGYLIGRNSATGQEGEHLRTLRPGSVFTDIAQYNFVLMLIPLYLSAEITSNGNIRRP